MTSGALRAATIALFATAVSVATPVPARAQDLSCDEPGAKEVRELIFRGNNAIRDDDLALRIVTTPSALFRRSLNLPLGARRCLDPVELPRDAGRLKRYYRDRGYHYTKVDTLVQAVSPTAVRVIFTIEEGPPTTLVTYDVSGLNAVPNSAEILNRRRLRVGQPFDLNLYYADIDSMVQRLRNSGYYRANHVKSHEVDSLVARVDITLLPGTRARFGEPEVTVTPAADDRGQEIKTSTVLRLLGMQPGDLYSDRAILEAQRSLFQLGTYRHIEIEPLPDSLQPPGDSIVVLHVRLTEDLMRGIDTEVGWATLDCGRVRAQYTDLNFARTARRLDLTAQASKIGFGEPVANEKTKHVCTLGGSSPLKDDPFSDTLHYFTGVAIQQPRLLGTRWIPTLSVYSERRGEYKAYLRTTNVGGDFSATRDLMERTQLRLGYGLEYGKTNAPEAVLCALFSLCDDQSRGQVSEFATLGAVSATVVRIRTDNPVSPTRGYVMRAEAKTSASKYFGTSEDLFFTKGSGDVGWYTPLGWHNVLAARLRGGAVFGRRLSDTLFFIPPQERLYAGGATSVRGFQQNELGRLVYIARERDVVRDTVTPPFRYRVPPNVGFERVVPTGGDALLVANLEYRIRDPFLFPDLVQYTLFVDAGSVWNRRDSISIKWTPGIGLRVTTPVGPIQMNIGYNPERGSKGPIYFEDPERARSPTRPDISPLYCVTPNNQINLELRDGVLQPPNSQCPSDYEPPEKKRFLQRLVLTFSLSFDF